MYRLFTLAFLALAFSATPVFAQEPTADSTPQEATVVARVNLYNCSMVESGRDLAIACDFVNNGARQPDVKYSIKLMRRYGAGEVLFDETVYDEVLTLEAGKTINKALTYTVPGSASGEMSVMLAVSNSEGLPLAFRSLGLINMPVLPDQAEITSESCYLSVVNERPSVQYTPQQGVDIAPDEVLVGHCYVKNLGTTPLSLTPTIVTTKRNGFGAVVEIPDFQNPTLDLGPNEVKEYIFTVPKPADPQAYDSTLSFSHNGTKSSNGVAFHYVIQGASATVQNITSDRPSYKQGDMANVTVFWSGPAGNFPGSRLGSTTETAHLMVVRIKNPAGEICGQSSADITNQQPQVIVPVPITTDCPDPTTVVDILDKDGQLLGTKTIQGPVNPTAKDALTKAINSPWLYGLLSVVMILLILAIAVHLYRHRKININSDSQPPMTTPMAVLFLLLAGFALFGGAGEVRADTFSDGGLWYWTADLDKINYTPSENMLVSGSGVSSLSCGNPTGNVTTFDSQTVATNIPTGETHTYMGTLNNGESIYTQNFTAPATAGNSYRMHFDGTWSQTNGSGYASDSGTYDMYYNVVASAATVSLTANGSGGPISVNQNDTVNLAWTTTGGPASCTATGNWSGTKAGSGGNENLNVGTTQKTYTIDCGGATDTVVVNVNAAPTVDLKVNGTDGPVTSNVNSTVNLVWTTTGSPASCTASGNWSGSKTASGGNESPNVGTAGTKTYTLTCGSATDTVTVNVPSAPAPTVDLTINSGQGPVTVAQNANVTLGWTTTGSPASCTASGAWSGSKGASSGSESQNVGTTNKTYTINCGGAVDSVTANVSAPPPAATCSDGIQNQGETGVDTGGPCSGPAPTCTDGIQNQGETGIDTGGPCGAPGGTCGASPLTCVSGTYSANPADTADTYYWTCGTAPTCSYYVPPPPDLTVIGYCPSNLPGSLSTNVSYPVGATSGGSDPADVRFRFNFGDGTPEVWVPTSGFQPRQYVGMLESEVETGHAWTTAGSYTVLLRAENTNGLSWENTCFVDVANGPGVGLLVNGQHGDTFDPVPVYKNEDFDVTWSSNAVDSCKLSGPGIVSPWENVNGSGIKTLNPSVLGGSVGDDGTYTIECRDASYISYIDRVNVEIVNRAPSAPVISEVAFAAPCTAGQRRFSVVSTDPDGDSLRYHIDWDNNGSSETSTSATASGVTAYICRATTQTSLTFNVRARDGLFSGLYSPWTSYTITPPAVVSATISGTGCFIAPGNSTCTNGSLTWNIQNATTPNVHNTSNNSSVSGNATGNNFAVTLSNGTTNFAARDGSTVLQTLSLNASCASGGTWNGTTCAAPPPPPPDPGLSITADKSQVRAGETTTVRWTMTTPAAMSCTVTGPGVNVPAFDPMSTTLPDNEPTGPITAKSEYTLRCTAAGTTFTDSVIVETTGTIEEV